MFKGLHRLVPGTELKLTEANKQSATKHSGSVHKTKGNGRSHNTRTVALQTSSCAATRATANEVGQNETTAQIHVNKFCGGNSSLHVWRFVNVCSLTDRSDFN
jgi:hypothetical protein